MASATKEQASALAALRSRSGQSLAAEPPIQAEAPSAPTTNHQTSEAVPGILADNRVAGDPARNVGSGAVFMSFDDVGGDAADTTQISLRLPRAHLRALRQWAAEQTMARSDARTVTAQQLILKLIDGAVRHREADRG